jgi:hypothetical protein
MNLLTQKNLIQEQTKNNQRAINNYYRSIK